VAYCLPALIYNGAADHGDFLAAAGHIRDLLGDARMEVVSEAGGFPAWENPGAANRLAADFLGQPNPTSID